MHSIGFPPALVGLFAVMVFVMLWLDIRAHRSNKPVSVSSAAWWSVGYVATACIFGGVLALTEGSGPASQFFTGYVMEKALSVDNLAVFIAVFSYFKVKPEFQHRVLHFGIIGAFVFRLIFVAIGASALHLFGGWVEGIFAIIIAYSAWSMWREFDSTDADDIQFEETLLVRLAKKIWPVYDNPRSGNRFFYKATNDKHRVVWMMTPLFMCLLVIEAVDVMFSFDSVPAVIAVTQDPFLIYASMVFAILGLRSLFFILSALMDKLKFLPHAIILVLLFIAVKLGLHAVWEIKVNEITSLVTVLGTLLSGCVLSWAYDFNGRISIEKD